MSRSPDFEPRTYRGGDLDELLPRIREELGPDAIVIRQREGLDGGIGGFFQKRCVEVVARRATPGVDAYDAVAAQPAQPVAPVPPGAAAAEPPAPAIAEIMRVASPFIDQLRAAEVAVAAPPAAEPAPVRAEEHAVTGAFGTSAYAITAGGAIAAVGPAAAAAVPLPAPAPAPALALVPDVPPDTAAVPAERSRSAAVHERALVAAGIAPELAAELVGATVSHVMPFAPKRSLKRALREALARRIPIAPPAASGSRAVAFVGAGGSGKTLCAARLAAAYAERSDLAVEVISLAPADGARALRELLVPAGVEVTDARLVDAGGAAGAATLTVIDTAAVAPKAAGEIDRLAAELARLGSPEVHVAVPATLSSAAVRSLLDGLAALRPAAIALTHLDEVGHAGPVIDEAISRGIAISYTSDGSAEDGFAPADPLALAAGVLA